MAFLNAKSAPQTICRWRLSGGIRLESTSKQEVAPLGPTSSDRTFSASLTKKRAVGRAATANGPIVARIRRSSFSQAMRACSVSTWELPTQTGCQLPAQALSNETGFNKCKKENKYSFACPFSHLNNGRNNEKNEIAYLHNIKT